VTSAPDASVVCGAPAIEHDDVIANPAIFAGVFELPGD
jgi:hypothetical protein